MLKATPQGRRLGYHAPEQVSNQELPDARPGILTTTLLGGMLLLLTGLLFSNILNNYFIIQIILDLISYSKLFQLF